MASLSGPRITHFIIAALLVTGAAIALPVAALAQPRADLDAELLAANSAIYNLDRDEALAHARQAIALAPDESRAHRTLASILWLDALFIRGAVTVDTYLGGVTGSQLSLPKPPAALDAEFKQELNRAITLADARVSRTPRDVNAMHDLGTALGLQASYTASVEGRILSAFGSARRAFDLEEDVLARDPRLLEAGTIVGTYRYAISSLGVASRMLAYMAGFGGGKARGIALIEAASHGVRGATEAKTALLLIYSREGRHQDAFRILGELSAAYPRNRIFVLERGAAAVRAGHAEQAEAILTAGLAGFDVDPRAKIPGERAVWLYKRATARISLNHPAAALQDIEDAYRSNPVEWVRGRLEVEQGKAADLQGRRNDALTLYRSARDLALRVNDPLSAAEASRWIEQPFHMPKG